MRLQQSQSLWVDHDTSLIFSVHGDIISRVPTAKIDSMKEAV